MIFLTKENLELNVFGLGYLAWYFQLKGPTFVITKTKLDD